MLVQTKNVDKMLLLIQFAILRFPLGSKRRVSGWKLPNDAILNDWVHPLTMQHNQRIVVSSVGGLGSCMDHFRESFVSLGRSNVYRECPNKQLTLRVTLMGVS